MGGKGGGGGRMAFVGFGVVLLVVLLELFCLGGLILVALGWRVMRWGFLIPRGAVVSWALCCCGMATLMDLL